MKESLSSRSNSKSNEYYHHDWVDKKNIHWIQDKPVAEKTTVPVSRKNISSVLNIVVTEEGDLVLPTFVKGSKRADLMTRNFENVTPDFSS